MDESKMNLKSSILFEHMRVAMMLYTHSTTLTYDEIYMTSQNVGIPTDFLSLIITDLVSNGIISSLFRNDYQIGYCITEFGQYFFKKFYSINEDAANL